MVLPSITDHQRQLVTMSFARLVPMTSKATVVFYNYLWEIAPETRTLFHSTEMNQQGVKLMQTLGMAVRGLHDPDSIAPMLHDLGMRHVHYGVTQSQFVPMKSALLWMVEQCLDDEFTPELRDAWIAAYDLIAELTVAAYEEYTSRTTRDTSE